MYQDLEGAYCITDIHDALALSDIGDNRKLFLIGTHVAEDGSEISSNMKDAKELIAQLVLEAQWQLFSYNVICAAEGDRLLVYGQFVVWRLKCTGIFSFWVWDSSENGV